MKHYYNFNAFLAARLLQGRGDSFGLTEELTDEAVTCLLKQAGFSSEDIALIKERPVKEFVEARPDAFENKFKRNLNYSGRLSSGWWDVYHKCYSPDSRELRFLSKARTDRDTADWTLRDFPELIQGDWVIREAVRLCDGTYNPAGFEHLIEPIAGHFVHASVNKPGCVSFTENAAKGGADRQASPTRAGRYLAKYFPALSGDQVREMAAMAIPEEVKFASTADDMEAVYVGGPNSCMAKGADEFDSHMHPVRVYAAGDLSVAYLGDMDAATDRVLCWPKKKIYGRVYGSQDGRIQSLLEALGYKNGSLEGARLLKVEDNDRDMWVVPYIDGENSVSNDGEFLKIGGNINASSQSGLISMHEEETVTLADTGETITLSEAEDVCTLCEYTEEWVRNPVEMVCPVNWGTREDIAYVNPDYAGEHGTYSDIQELYVHYDIVVEIGDSGEHVSRNYFANNYIELCEEYAPELLALEPLTEAA